MLGMKLMMETASRLQPGGGWWQTGTCLLAAEAGRDAGYCLDAPDDIPAGGMYADEIGDEPLPMPMTVARDE